jgi:hypothetical protein
LAFYAVFPASFVNGFGSYSLVVARLNQVVGNPILSFAFLDVRAD